MKDIQNMPANPEAHAMRLTSIRFNGAPPRADKRFIVEAFWMTVEVRFLLASAAEQWMNALPNKSTTTDVHHMIWGSSIDFIYRSCVRDAEIAQAIATESNSRRQATRSFVLLLKAKFEEFRFGAAMLRRKPLTEEKRRELAEKAEQLSNDFLRDSKNLQSVYARQPITEDDEAWLAMHLSGPTFKIANECAKLIKSIREDQFYARVSDEDRLAVIKAFSAEFSAYFKGQLHCISDWRFSSHRPFLQVSKWASLCYW